MAKDKNSNLTKLLDSLLTELKTIESATESLLTRLEEVKNTVEGLAVPEQVPVPAGHPPILESAGGPGGSARSVIESDPDLDYAYEDLSSDFDLDFEKSDLSDVLKEFFDVLISQGDDNAKEDLETLNKLMDSLQSRKKRVKPNYLRSKSEKEDIFEGNLLLGETLLQILIKRLEFKTLDKVLRFLLSGEEITVDFVAQVKNKFINLFTDTLKEAVKKDDRERIAKIVEDNEKSSTIKKLIGKAIENLSLEDQGIVEGIKDALEFDFDAEDFDLDLDFDENDLENMDTNSTASKTESNIPSLEDQVREFANKSCDFSSEKFAKLKDYMKDIIKNLN